VFSRAFAILVLVLVSLPAAATDVATPPPAIVDSLRAALAAGDVVCRLSEPDELTALLGSPDAVSDRDDGGMTFREMTWAGVEAVFGRMRREEAPLTLRGLAIDGERLDLGCDETLVLRGRDDLAKLDTFTGLQGVSLARLDLTGDREYLLDHPFDSRTVWPPADRLPAGFNPSSLLARGRTPGLGIAALHADGIDGRGVGIAIIDQPLLLGHEEYAGALVRYDATGLAGMPPQMHASPVASIAVGRTVGVAPRAELSFFAVPMWKRDNAVFTGALRRISALNRTLPPDQRIRAVSVSTGGFERWPGHDDLRAALADLEAQGVLVVTCARDRIPFGTLILPAGGDPDRPEDWQAGRYVFEDDILRVPCGGRVLASHRGVDVVWRDPQGGMSWGAPYLAGLAALAFQVAPELTPAEVVELLIATATPTDAGPVVAPLAFLAAVAGRS